MRISKSVYCAAYTFCFLLLGGAGGASGQEATDVCLKSGTKIHANRLEARGGKFYIYPAGVSSPMEVDADQIKSIGDADGCGGTPLVAAPLVPSAKFSIRGSNTVGERLMPMIIDAYARKTTGSSAVFRPRGHEEQDIEIRQGSQLLASIDFQAKGSGIAPPALMKREIAIGMMSRAMKEQEQKDFIATQNIDPLAPGNEHVVALDGLAVIVNPDNPVKKLTLDETARIFAGEITNWKDVHGKDNRNQDVTGPDLPIHVHARDDKSGTYDTFKSVVIERDGAKRKLAHQAVRYESSENLSDAVTKDLGAIGFIGLPYINKNHPLSIASGCGLNYDPSKFSVKTEEYPLARRLFLYTLGTPSEPVARDILQFAMSDEAQKTVGDAGFIDQSIEFQDERGQSRWTETLVDDPQTALPAEKVVPSKATSAFGKVMRTVRRSSLVLRFAHGESDLDNRALQDVDRLGRYLKQPALSGRQLIIIGFADSDGTWEYNTRLAEKRARTVTGELRNRGVSVKESNILSLSYMAPVACNDSDAGRAKNRRVEIWIAK